MDDQSVPNKMEQPVALIKLMDDTSNLWVIAIFGILQSLKIRLYPYCKGFDCRSMLFWPLGVSRGWFHISFLNNTVQIKQPTL